MPHQQPTDVTTDHIVIYQNFVVGCKNKYSYSNIFLDETLGWLSKVVDFFESKQNLKKQ